jgi:DNA-binding response OmpR family regulator
MRKRIMVVHSYEVSSAVSEVLANGDFDPRFVSDISRVVKLLLEQRPNLLLLDIPSWQKPIEELLWELGNLKSTQSIRKVILSAAAKVEDKIAALDLGADDFLVKPISSRELLARLDAVLRAHPTLPVEEDMQSLGTLCLYRDAMEVSVGAERTKLSPTEFNLLVYLMDHPGRVFSREQLLENVWIPWEIADRRVVDVYVWRLREKIEEDPSQPRRLLTRRREGYSLVDPQGPLQKADAQNRSKSRPLQMEKLLLTSESKRRRNRTGKRACGPRLPSDRQAGTYPDGSQLVLP